ncbi:MAG: hypothetical protein KDC95_16615, partial [Planctomycetes bacterium]|nr:hypothetical protein [Planctomycetota bacterium]
IAMTVLGVFASGHARAQSAWRQLTPVAGPTARFWSGAVGRTADVLVFGGGVRGDYTRNADTWLFKNGAWTQQAPATSPSGRSGHALAFDRDRSSTVLFGGYDGTNAYASDTWVYDGSDWKKSTTNSSPPGRAGHGLVFDAARKVMVLFGGATAASPRTNDTWEFDGATWKQIVTSHAPPPRAYHAMAWDGISGRVVLFGGYDTAARGDAWAYDGSDWTQLAGGPPARFAASMAFDELRRRVVLQGGFALGLDSDTWEWDGLTWSQNPASPQPTTQGYVACAYDPSTLRVVRFFGETKVAVPTDEVWSFGTTSVASYMPFGSSCPGSSGIAVHAGGPRLPWVGDTADLSLSGAVPTSAAAFVLGLSDTTWGALTLPIDLTVLGATGCSLYASMDVVVAVPTSATGTASIAIKIPPIASLSGARFFTQFFAFDIAANSLGMTLTNAVTGTIGVR